jgi:tRNA nucleotidyltransferase (CCA-adding enzyme)
MNVKKKACLKSDDFKEILKKELEKIKLNDEAKKEIIKISEDFRKKLEKAIGEDVFIGGSLAKNTLIKKNFYDIDIFIRFLKPDSNKKAGSAKVEDNLEKALKKMKVKFLRVHGSRDYFQVKNKNMVFEVIPVKKIKNPKEAENITDLSFFHVSYVSGKLKDKKIADEIMLAKAFCHAIGCYGAESYIQGFSGYALELLMIHFKSFLNFLKAITRSKEKIIIDSSRFYKNRQEILISLNEAKLSSPIIVIDPTYKERNATAALSQETFDRFKEKAKEFLKKPDLRFFENKKIDKNQLEKEAKKRKAELIEFQASTDRQEGDIAGSKLRKFFKFVGNQLAKYYDILREEFVYSGKHEANYYFIARKKKEIIMNGPYVNDVINSDKFRKEHKKSFEKSGKLYSKEKPDISKIKIYNSLKKHCKEMSVVSLKLD